MDDCCQKALTEESDCYNSAQGLIYSLFVDNSPCRTQRGLSPLDSEKVSRVWRDRLAVRRLDTCLRTRLVKKAEYSQDAAVTEVKHC